MRQTVTIELTDDEVEHARDLAEWVSRNCAAADCVPSHTLAVKIAAALPRPFQVGDRVRWGEPSCLVTILAIDGEDAWLRDDNGVRWQSRLSRLEAAP